MNPGDTFFGFDKRGHLWTVLTDKDANGEVVVANFTTHNANVRRSCNSDCLVAVHGEHPYLRHESCIFFQEATLTSNAALELGVTEGVYHPQAPLSDGL